jgi:hypothetical protein
VNGELKGFREGLYQPYAGRGMIATRVHDEITVGMPDYPELEQAAPLAVNDDPKGGGTIPLLYSIGMFCQYERKVVPR